MNQFLRRIRGIVGTGLAWAVGWGGLFGAIILGVILWGAVFGPDDALEGLELFPLLKMVYGAGQVGFLGGCAFGAVFSVLERHKNLKEITFKRVALWGVLGGLAVVALFYAIYGTPIGGIQYVVLGIGSATGTVALAKRADRKLIEGDGDSEESLEAYEDLPALEGE